MELFLYYLLRASVLMALFYGLYKVFFADNTFHNVNRFSLIFMLLMISMLPLFRFSLIPEKRPEPVTETFLMDFSSLPVMEFMEMQPRVEIPWIQILIILFVVGFLFTFIRYLIGLGQIIGIIRKAEKQTLEDHTVLCIADKNISPFSWMRYIVLSRKELSVDNQAVIRHEKAHIRLRHSFDMIFFDVFTCIFWFNPFSWLLRREIQAVHEYQADEQVLNQGIDSKQYQLLLIRKSVGEYKFALANNFRQRDLHKRITMMKKNKTNRRMKWNYMMALPVLFLAMIALSVPKLNASIPEKESDETVEKEAAVSIQTRDSVMISVSESVANTDPLDLGKTKIVPKDSVGTVKGANITIRGFSSKNNPLMIVDDKRITSDEFKELNPDDIESVSILKEKAAIDIYGDEGKNGVVLITTKNSNKNVIAIGSGSMDSIRGDVKGLIIRTKENNPQYLDILNENFPLIVVDGEKMSKDFEMNSIKPEEIESMSVLKDESATEIYGDEGKNGVIIITKKKGLVGATTRNNVFRLIGLEGKRPLILFDNKAITEAELTLIDQNSVSSTAFFESEEAVKRYGEKAKDGAVVLSSKKQTSKRLSNITIDRINEKVRTKGFNDRNTAIIIDGKLASKAELENMDSKSIRVINIDPIDNYPIIAERYNIKGKERLIQVFTKN